MRPLIPRQAWLASGGSGVGSSTTVAVAVDGELGKVVGDGRGAKLGAGVRVGLAVAVAGADVAPSGVGVLGWAQETRLVRRTTTQQSRKVLTTWVC